MENYGAFATKSLTPVEKKVYGEFLKRTLNSPAIEFVIYLLGDDYLKFIDILAGTTLKIPTSKTLERDLESVQIFVDALKGEFSDSCLKGVCKSYSKNINQVKRSVDRVGKVLGTEDILTGVAKENYMNNIIQYLKDLYGYNSGSVEEVNEEDLEVNEDVK